MTDSATPSGEDEQPQQEPVGNPDVQYCPHCGDPISSHQRHWYDDLVLNRYRTEFECPGCGYHGEVFRHSPGERDPETMTDGGRPEHAVTQTDSKRAIVGALRDVGPAGMATAAVAQKIDLDTKQAGELLRQLERESVVEKVGAPGLGDGQWRLVGDEQ